MGTQRAVLTRFRLAAVLAVGALVMVPACSTVTGTPVAAEIDVRILDVGDYPIEPLDVDDVHVASDGPILEGLRMAGAIAVPHELDDDLVHNWGTDVIDSPKKAADASSISNVNLPTLERHGFLVAFDIAEGSEPFPTDVRPTDTDAKVTRIVLMRFPDAARASTAARELESTDFAVSPDNRPVDVPGYAQAHAHWRPGIKTVSALLAQDEIVISVFLQHPTPDLDTMTTRLREVFDAQLPLLDDFEPTPPEEFDELPRDPDGMLRRALTPGPRDQRVPISSRDYAAWSGRAVIHFQPTDEPGMREAWDSGGVDAVAQFGTTTVLRFRDNAAATAFGTAWSDSQGSHTHSVDPPADVPDARCVERSATADTPATSRCYVTYRRYAAFVTGDDPTDTSQQAAAQYALLVNTQ
ncbi:hypothetical protein GV794_03395 [Nocardia cyriacigeorgica]|uniref:Sensor domain-containing protein n=1 Tax=Nocardia cyriacigeorgica TaxID=135487 RepID=A0A6P1DFH9_9NOCA|nr:hypothetical protein [Nocardia cyriacigeorgica]NEW48269.1 hypothetical protein [Nocardia cyriacigeorgica]NEW54714.1 hypothetical protein [Nocardia cyriacigeorgica]